MLYRDYKKFDRGKFKKELEILINENSNVIREYYFFEQVRAN